MTGGEPRPSATGGSVRPAEAAVPAETRHSTLLLATDLSPASDAATEWALDLARRLGAAILAVSVIDPGALRLPGGRDHRLFESRVQRDGQGGEVFRLQRNTGPEIPGGHQHGGLRGTGRPSHREEQEKGAHEDQQRQGNAPQREPQTTGRGGDHVSSLA